MGMFRLLGWLGSHWSKGAELLSRTQILTFSFSSKKRTQVVGLAQGSGNMGMKEKKQDTVFEKE